MQESVDSRELAVNDAEFKDRLIDSLLEEEVEGRALPDLTGRIMQRVSRLADASGDSSAGTIQAMENVRIRPSAQAVPASVDDSTDMDVIRRPSRRWWAGWPAAAAAGIALMLIGFGLASVLQNMQEPSDPIAELLAGDKYPQPKLTGDYVANPTGRDLARGDRVRTAEGEARLVLGGYSQVDLRPGTEVVLTGNRKAEAIELVEGSVLCKVEKGIGQFTVQSAMGDVEVVGTEFEVSVIEPNLSDIYARQAKPHLAVSVREGIVKVHGPLQVHTLTKGQQVELPQSGMLVGEVVVATDTRVQLATPEAGKVWLVVPDVEDAQGQFVPDRALVEQLADIEAGDRVRTEWEYDGRLLLTHIEPVVDQPDEPQPILPETEQEDLPAKVKAYIATLEERNRDVHEENQKLRQRLNQLERQLDALGRKLASGDAGNAANRGEGQDIARFLRLEEVKIDGVEYMGLHVNLDTNRPAVYLLPKPGGDDAQLPQHLQRAMRLAQKLEAGDQLQVTWTAQAGHLWVKRLQRASNP